MNLEGKSLGRDFVRYAVPSVVAQWVFALYTMVDGMFVARGVGETALASVNLSLPFVNLVFALSLAMAVGSSTIIAIHFGEKDHASANRAYTQNLVTVLVMSLAITAAVLVFLTPIARFLGASEADGTLEYVKTYAGTIAAFAPFFVLAYYFEILIKADGRPKMATFMVALGTVLNFILDYVFIFVIPWGVFGAAFATGLSQMAVTLCFAAYFFSRHANLRLQKFKFSPALAWRTFRLGLPSGITDFSAGAAIFLFNQFILRYLGTDALVSYTVIAYVNTIVVMSMNGVTQGLQPLASYYHGKGDVATCKKLLRYALIFGGALTGAVMLAVMFLASPLTNIFISADLPALRAATVDAFRIFAISFVLVGFNVIVGGYFTAVERAKSSLLISLSRGFVFVALSLWALTALMGGAGVWWAPTLSEGLCVALSAGLLVAYGRSQGKTARPLPRKRATGANH